MLWNVVHRFGEMIRAPHELLSFSAEEDVQRGWKGGRQIRKIHVGDVANTQQQLKPAVIRPEFGGGGARRRVCKALASTHTTNKAGPSQADRHEVHNTIQLFREKKTPTSAVQHRRISSSSPKLTYADCFSDLESFWRRLMSRRCFNGPTQVLATFAPDTATAGTPTPGKTQSPHE